jgi:hypothetical protein
MADPEWEDCSILAQMTKEYVLPITFRLGQSQLSFCPLGSEHGLSDTQDQAVCDAFWTIARTTSIVW